MLTEIIDTLKLLKIHIELSITPRPPIDRGNYPNLAIFAWALPPNSNAGVFRPLSFIKYGERLGWHISAFHAPAPSNQSQNGQSLLLQIPEHTQLHSVPPSRLRPSYRLTPQIDGGYCNALEMALYAINTLSESPPDAVLASGPPFHTFVAASFVAKHFGVPLILDYRDEWTECPFDFVSKNSDDVKWEKRCLETAAAVIFTTQSHIEHQTRVFSELSYTKTHLISNGWDVDDFDAAGSEARRKPVSDSDIFQLSHIGTLAGHNLPGNFLSNVEQAFDMLPVLRERLRIRFVGRRSPEADNQLQRFAYQDNLEIIDHVDKRTANRLMMESDALLLISAMGLERYLPGKLFDYVASRRPILVAGQPGESANVIKLLHAGLHIRDASELVSALEAPLRWSNPDSSLVSSWLNDHRRDVLAAKLFSLLESLTADAHRNTAGVTS